MKECTPSATKPTLPNSTPAAILLVISATLTTIATMITVVPPELAKAVRCILLNERRADITTLLFQLIDAKAF